MSHTPEPSDADPPYVKNVDDVLTAVAADLSNGLTAQEAARRLAVNGANSLRAAPPVADWRRVLAHFQDPLVYLLLAAIAIAVGAWIIEGRVGWPVDAMVITVVVLINAVIGYVQSIVITAYRNAATSSQLSASHRLILVQRSTSRWQNHQQHTLTRCGCGAHSRLGFHPAGPSDHGN